MIKAHQKVLSNSQARRIRLIALASTLSVLLLGPFSAICRGESPPSSPRLRNSISFSRSRETVQVVEADIRRAPPDDEEPPKTIADPLESINRLSFHVNDRFYFWILKPVASGYRRAVPQPMRVGVRNFFSNLSSPVRVVNCLLQFKVKGAAKETTRFLVNSTLGVAGFVDLAKKEFNIDRQEEDFGQTLAFYGIGPIFYVDWPILGPSSARDTVGFAADFFLSPWTYLLNHPIYVSAGLGALDQVNNTSLTLGTYEDLKEAALDPYIAMRDAYHQYRESKIAE